MPSLIVTKDGSHSLLHEQLNETYHSIHGAVQESMYVFIEQGLREFARQNPSTIRVFEVGFGTGLNALLAYEYSQSSGIPLVYHTLEAYPLPREVWSQLNYGDSRGMRDSFETLHNAPWNEIYGMSENFSLYKILRKLGETALKAGSFDVVFFDAFAPSKQPDMWTMDVLAKVCEAIAPGGIFVTYCAKGQLKRDLRALGMDVETLPGPPGKKEMVRARRAKSPV
jgi:tRNA U34 5-methylaminomethyl-2-thiouridine-forming methyltransferase MnmC